MSEELKKKVVKKKVSKKPVKKVSSKPTPKKKAIIEKPKETANITSNEDVGKVQLSENEETVDGGNFFTKTISKLSRKKKKGKGDTQKEADRKADDNKPTNPIRKLGSKRNLKNKPEYVELRDDAFAPPAGYKFTPSYIKTGNHYGTILKVVNKYGQNRNMEFGWFVRLIPRITVEGVRGYLIQSDKPVSNSEQLKIINEDVVGSVQTIQNAETTRRTTAHDLNIRDLAKVDLDRASILHGNQDVIIDADIRVLLVSDDPDAITEQIRQLNSHYGDEMSGIHLTSIGGEQEELLESLFTPPAGTDNDYTWMSSDFAGNDHMVRRGLTDDDGWALGTLVYSYAGGTATMALDRSFSTEELQNAGRICIATADSSYIHAYNPQFPASSLWGQVIANNVMAHGKKVYHIVLNDFNYYGGSKPKRNANGDIIPADFSAKSSLNNVLEHTNFAKGGINPLQVYGREENIIQAYGNNLKKIARIFHLLSGRKLTSQEQNLLIENLNNFYISQKLWIPEAEKYPKRLSIVGMSDPTKFPTMGDFISEFTNSLTGATHAREKTTETEINMLKNLQRVLRNALNENNALFNQPSTVPEQLDANIYQHYFHFSDLAYNRDILEAQFINVFDYITNFAEQDDVIMIHGMDNLSVDTISQYLSSAIKVLRRRKVRFAYSFDTVGSNTLTYRNAVSKEDHVQMADMFNMEGYLYEDFEDDFDYTILSTMTDKELGFYEQLVNDGEKLPTSIRKYMTESSNTRYQIRRKYDGVSNVVQGDFYI